MFLRIFLFAIIFSLSCKSKKENSVRNTPTKPAAQEPVDASRDCEKNNSCSNQKKNNATYKIIGNYPNNILQAVVNKETIWEFQIVDKNNSNYNSRKYRAKIRDSLSIGNLSFNYKSSAHFSLKVEPNKVHNGRILVDVIDIDQCKRISNNDSTCTDERVFPQEFVQQVSVPYMVVLQGQSSNNNTVPCSFIKPTNDALSSFDQENDSILDSVVDLGTTIINDKLGCK